MIEFEEGMYRNYQIKSKIGLKGSLTFQYYSCIVDNKMHRLYVWLGETPIEKFTKSTLLNFVSFAEKVEATAIIFIQNRNHA